MEGQFNPTNSLKFLESKRLKVAQDGSSSNKAVKLITAANEHNLILVGCNDQTIRAVCISDLLDSSKPGQPEASILHQLKFKPTLLTVARNGFSSTLLIAGLNATTNCPIISIYDLDSKTSLGDVGIREAHASEIVDYAWHPNYHESIIALCSNNGHLILFAIQRLKKKVAKLYCTDKFKSLTCCWSPKGKNLAIGTVHGQVLRLEPVFAANETNFNVVNNSTINFSYTPEHQLVRLRWINKTYLLSIHKNSTEAIFSVLTIKPNKPYICWTGALCDNQATNHYVAHVANLTNYVVCSSSASGEAAIFGALGQKDAASSDIGAWSCLIVDEEGARIELPLDANNRETHAQGLTVAFLKDGMQNHPILIYLSSDNVICPYTAIHSEDKLKIPEFQPIQAYDFEIANEAIHYEVMQPITGLQPVPAHILGFTNLSIQPDNKHQVSVLETAPAPLNLGLSSMTIQSENKQPVTQSKTIPANNFGITNLAVSPSNRQQVSGLKAVPTQTLGAANESTQSDNRQKVAESVPTPMYAPEIAPETSSAWRNLLREDIDKIKAKFDYNEAYLSILDESNHVRSRLDQLYDLNNSYQEALSTIKDDIDALDLGLLETLYLIEYIKSRGQGAPRKRSLDPNTLKKVDDIKTKAEYVERKLEELDVLVDVAWEEHVRRQVGTRRINSLELIYKALATDQKVINVLRRKIERPSEKLRQPESQASFPVLRQKDNSKFEQFLASRNVVPVRKPIVYSKPLMERLAQK